MLVSHGESKLRRLEYLIAVADYVLAVDKLLDSLKAGHASICVEKVGTNGHEWD